MGDGTITMLQVATRRPDLDHVTTAPLLGQPAAASPAAPRSGRAGLLAVCGMAVAVVAVLGGLLAGRVDPLVGALIAVAALTAFTGAQLVLMRKQRQLAGALQHSQ